MLNISTPPPPPLRMYCILITVALYLWAACAANNFIFLAERQMPYRPVYRHGNSSTQFLNQMTLIDTFSEQILPQLLHW